MRGPAPWDADEARRLIDERRALQGATLPILHALQDHFGYVDSEAVPLIAAGLNLSKAEVHGVVTFYHDYRGAPAAGPVLKLCRAEACQSMGCEGLVEHLAARHHIAVDGYKSGDGLAVETVYCLGNCALSPAALLDGAPMGRLDRAGLDALVAGARA